MRFYDLFYLSLENFKNRKSRACFTILGVSVAIGAILFLVSLGYGLQRTILEKITTTESLLTLDVISPETKIITLNEKTLNRISAIENVEKVSARAFFPGQISLGELTSETTINLVNPDFFSLSGISFQKGRVFGKRDHQKVIVNPSVAKLFNLKPEQILGKKLKFSIFLPKEETGGVIKTEAFTKKGFRVIGIIEEIPGSPSQIFLKRGDLAELPIEEYQSAKVKVISKEFLEDVRGKLIGMGFSVSAFSDIIAQANRIFRAIQIVLAIFGVIALIVAAIGLVNTMTISLLERTNEIGIMRAIGASSQDIKKLFLIDSTVIGFFGGIGGIGIGILTAEIFNAGVNILARALGGQPVVLFSYQGWFIVFIILLSTAVSLGAGFWPAKRAAKLNPLQALRYK